jgi:hypothetical protein
MLTPCHQVVTIESHVSAKTDVGNASGASLSGNPRLRNIQDRCGLTGVKQRWRSLSTNERRKLDGQLACLAPRR